MNKEYFIKLFSWLVIIVINFVLLWFFWNLCIPQIFGLKFIGLLEAFALIMILRLLLYIVSNSIKFEVNNIIIKSDEGD